MTAQDVKAMLCKLDKQQTVHLACSAVHVSAGSLPFKCL